VLEVFDKDSIVEDISSDMDTLVDRVAELAASISQVRVESDRFANCGVFSYNKNLRLTVGIF
jgi:uncharacterized protein YoxC